CDGGVCADHREDDVTDEYEQIIGKMFNGKPHWGKNKDVSFIDVPSKYPHLPRFLKVREAFDPRGLFLNEWAKRVLGLSQQPVAGVMAISAPMRGLCHCAADVHCNPALGEVSAGTWCWGLSKEPVQVYGDQCAMRGLISHCAADMHCNPTPALRECGYGNWDHLSAAAAAAELHKSMAGMGWRMVRSSISRSSSVAWVHGSRDGRAHGDADFRGGREVEGEAVQLRGESVGHLYIFSLVSSCLFLPSFPSLPRLPSFPSCSPLLLRSCCLRNRMKRSGRNSNASSPQKRGVRLQEMHGQRQNGPRRNRKKPRVVTIPTALHPFMDIPVHFPTRRALASRTKPSVAAATKLG
ncbi:unnamed protein product, partial [Closterium sp. NIES-64]